MINLDDILKDQTHPTILEQASVGLSLDLAGTSLCATHCDDYSTFFDGLANVEWLSDLQHIKNVRAGTMVYVREKCAVYIRDIGWRPYE